jgi:hypothetical protein
LPVKAPAALMPAPSVMATIVYATSTAMSVNPAVEARRNFIAA